MKTTLIGFTVLALSASGAAMAGQYSKGQTSFKTLDQNGDGYVTQMEAKNHSQLRENWKNADANRDGQIDPAEFSAFEAMHSQSGSEK